MEVESIRWRAWSGWYGGVGSVGGCGGSGGSGYDGVGSGGHEVNVNGNGIVVLREILEK